MSRIGVFICHCGENISATVDCERVAQETGKLEGVEFATDYKYMCSDPGQTLIKNAIKEHHLDGVVVGSWQSRQTFTLLGRLRIFSFHAAYIRLQSSSYPSHSVETTNFAQIFLYARTAWRIWLYRLRPLFKSLSRRYEFTRTFNLHSQLKSCARGDRIK